jgi:hypothetical protein
MHTLIAHHLTVRPAFALPTTVIVLLVLAASAANAEDFCALTVKLETAATLPPSRTWVELIDQSGNVERREQVQGSAFNICDFGFGPHTLRVGTNECLPVSVSNLRLVIGTPLHLTVFMNLCGYQDVMRTGCLLYLRVSDQHGTPVPDASVIYPADPGALTKTDSFGRLQILVPRGTRDLVVAKDGFADTNVSTQCRDNEEIDLAVPMKRPKPAGGNN